MTHRSVTSGSLRQGVAPMHATPHCAAAGLQLQLHDGNTCTGSSSGSVFNSGNSSRCSNSSRSERSELEAAVCEAGTGWAASGETGLLAPAECAAAAAVLACWGRRNSG